MIPRLPTLGHQRCGARAHNANGKASWGGGGKKRRRYSKRLTRRLVVDQIVIKQHYNVFWFISRHRLGCFCTHHSLGGRIRPPPVLSRKRMDVERRTRRHSKDLDETLPNHFRKFKIEVTCQVKVKSKVKIGSFQVADRSDLKRSIFRPKLSICTPKDQAKVLTSEIVSYLAQVKFKVRSEKVTISKIFKCVV